jgi:hypothetical protein
VSAALKRSELRWGHPRPERSGNLPLAGLLARAVRARRRLIPSIARFQEN